MREDRAEFLIMPKIYRICKQTFSIKEFFKSVNHNVNQWVNIVVDRFKKFYNWAAWPV